MFNTAPRPNYFAQATHACPAWTTRIDAEGRLHFEAERWEPCTFSHCSRFDGIVVNQRRYHWIDCESSERFTTDDLLPEWGKESHV